MNKSLFKIHSWAALFAFIPLLVICITGSLLVFKHEIDSLLMHDKVRVEPQAQRAPLDALLNTINHQQPDYEVVGWVLFQDDARADVVYVMEKGTSEWSYLLLNPYTNTLLSTPVPHDHYFTDWLLELHYTFLLHDVGLLITSVFSIALLLLGLTGFILYRKFWKNFFTLRWNARMVVYFSDLHKMIGIVSAPILVILAFTGGWWNIAAYLHEMEEHSDGFEHHRMQERLYSDQLSLDALVAEAEQSVDGFTATYLSLPWEPQANITVWGEVPTGNILSSQYNSTTSFDAQTGEKLSTYDIREAGLGARIIDTYTSLHYGDFAGLFSRIIWAVLGTSPVILSITGITLWVKRRKQRSRAKLKRQQARQAIAAG
ncbi:PepSY domain-containing protein [Gilvimarinus agarilyticus]|uniref:PepSY-associated TM helix domain-containing protein n=1 Tax=Gilvimarinus sp. 2_MG-2023 TaxID=3062666 RepID=UPI001C0A2218|nr:PepSY-associated TM helix domain-containing protein [Gilvimarinus sp. 2_MG-2023]MBU2884962.1 PepSY domain-containing protein [Gilvimarinus agarilyticus]MDO6569860.1 PepSY-associated TM helix domain-containing protein [Gilvimarinus sp. 2_MG-2023]